MKTIKKRRKQNKTDYLKRLKLLKSGVPRVVFRRTNKYIIAQYVESKEAKDKVVIGTNSKELLEYGWSEKASLKSITASYLTGYLIGKKILKQGLKKPILDAGMTRALYKNKVYAFLKGLIDAGIEINCKEEAFPEESRIKGEHMKTKIEFDKIKSGIDKKW